MPPAASSWTACPWDRSRCSCATPTSDSGCRRSSRDGVSVMDSLLAEVEGLRRSEPAAALKRLERDFASAVKRADATGRGTLWRLRAHVLRSLRRTREAAAAYRRAAMWFAEAGDVREQGRCA